MSAVAPPPVPLVMLEHDGGDRSLHVEDLEGDVVEVWSFFERGQGRREGAAALAGDDVPPSHPSS